jgi:PmbA protein
MDILEQLKSRAEQVEVVDTHSESTMVNFEANKVKSSQVEETKGVAVRVVKNGKLGFAASSAASGDTPAMEKLVTNVIESAAFGDQVPIRFPASQPAPQVMTYDPTLAELPVSRLVEIGQEVIDLILPIEPDAKINVNLDRRVQSLSIRNQAGAEISFKRSPFSMLVEIARVKGDDILILFDMGGTTVWERDYMAFVRRLGEKLELAQKITTIQPGRMPVLFSPNGALVLGIPLMEGLNGKNVYTGISPLAGKVGEKLFDDKTTLVDDGTLDGRLGSAPYDDEGVAHRRNVLVEKGVLQSFVYDLKTAAQSGVESTGNGSRSLFNPPHPAPTNLIFEPGETPLADIIAGMEEGLLVEDVLGLGQGNIISGAFSNPLSLAFKIEKGKTVGRVKNASIAGNVYDLLKNVAAVSQETHWVYNAMSLPYILLPDMNIVTQA